MTKETLIQRILDGETITSEDVAAVRAAEELAQLQTEAGEIANIRSIEAERQRRAEARNAAFLRADSEAEAGAADFENAMAEFDVFARNIGNRLVAARARIINAQSDFNQTLRAEIPNINKLQNSYEPLIEKQLEDLLLLLRSQGAAMRAIRGEDWRNFTGASFRFPFVGNYYRSPNFAFGPAAALCENIASHLPAVPPSPLQKAA